MHNLIIMFLTLFILAGFIAVWMRGFNGRAHRVRRSHYTRISDLPIFQRLRWAFAVLIARFLPASPGQCLLVNFNSAEHLDGKITKIADATLAARFLVVKVGTDIGHIAVCGAADEPLGVCSDAPLIGESGSVDVFGAAKGTRRALAGAAITAGADVYTMAGGYLSAEPTVAGTYWLVGRALQAGAAPSNGVYDDFEFAACKPIRVLVIAAPTQTSSTTIANLHSTAVAPVKTDFDALLVEAGKLQADYYALRAAIAAPALVKYL